MLDQDSARTSTGAVAYTQQKRSLCYKTIIRYSITDYLAAKIRRSKRRDSSSIPLPTEISQKQRNFWRASLHRAFAPADFLRSTICSTLGQASRARFDRSIKRPRPVIINFQKDVWGKCGCIAFALCKRAVSERPPRVSGLRRARQSFPNVHNKKVSGCRCPEHG